MPLRPSPGAPPGTAGAGPAWSSGLRPGDIIIAVNQRDANSPDDVTTAIKRHPDAPPVNLIRGNGELMVVIE